MLKQSNNLIGNFLIFFKPKRIYFFTTKFFYFSQKNFLSLELNLSIFFLLFSFSTLFVPFPRNLMVSENRVQPQTNFGWTPSGWFARTRGCLGGVPWNREFPDFSSLCTYQPFTGCIRGDLSPRIRGENVHLHIRGRALARG